MITHKIIRAPDKQLMDVNGKFKGEHHSEDHKRFILARSLMRNEWKIGQIVRHRGQKFQITDIYENNYFVVWQGLMPKFIELYDPESNQCIVVHPSEIKRSRR